MKALSTNKFIERALARLLIRTIQLERDSFKENISDACTIMSTPETGVMKFWLDAEYLKSPTHTLRSGYIKELRDVICCPKSNILMTKHREIILDSIPAKSFRYSFPKNYSILKEIFLYKTEKISGPCTMFHSCFKGYYPSLIYNIPRLYLLHQLENSGKKVKLLISRQLTEVERIFLPKILPKNVEICLLEQDRKYIAEDYIFLDFLTISGALPSKYLDFFRERVCPKRERKRCNRIFISRKVSSKGRQIVNEDELFEELSHYGFKRYLLEEMSTTDQLNLFYDSEYVVAPHGAGLTNILFAEKIKIIELFPSRFIWTPAYYFLSKSMGHTYQYWCSGEDLNYKSFEAELSKQRLSPISYFKNRNFNADISKISKMVEISLNE